MDWLLIVCVVLVFLVLLIKRNIPSPAEYPYQTKEVLFSPAERSFYGVLAQAVGDKGIVLAKVRVADILQPSKGLNRRDWQTAFNRISAKHFDYVVCAPDSLAVIAVLELDDRSHAKRNRQQRDKLINGACAAAGLSLHRIKAQSAYSVPAIRELLFSTEQDKVQPCPKCGSDLIVKSAKSGKYKGKEFLACPSFPECRYLRPMGTAINSEAEKSH